eukprot:TRINITY_DN14132_c0_g3_i1.p1 TRINITY_DN14132_c0_g3~~TRINITY_DN14132_c0_g3_i1.p1  ORF type:complete len:281 (+),score=52.89 TRINITY_DN14132_c0_g3_i1:110-952(+)
MMAESAGSNDHDHAGPLNGDGFCIEERPALVDKALSDGTATAAQGLRAIDQVGSSMHLEAIRALSATPRPDDSAVWSLAAQWQLAWRQNPPLPAGGVVAYLEELGYKPADALRWRVAPGSDGLAPELNIYMDHTGHEERAGHTWYLARCELTPALLEESVAIGPGGRGSASHGQTLGDDCTDDGADVLAAHGDNAETRRWFAPRRLSQLRADLHDPIKLGMGPEAYAAHFGATPFASLFAPGGTTARLDRWLKSLCDSINSGLLSPDLVAMTLCFFQCPS